MFLPPTNASPHPIVSTICGGFLTVYDFTPCSSILLDATITGSAPQVMITHVAAFFVNNF